MDDHKLEDDGDLFEEIQSRIEKEMFRGPSDAVEEKSASKSGSDKEMLATMDDSKVKIVVEVDVADSDTNDPAVDDSFLEEVDFISPAAGDMVSEETSGAAVGNDSVEDGSKVAPLPPRDEAVSSRTDDLAGVQEDDLFLGELIDREMVGVMKAPGAADEEPDLADAGGLQDAPVPAETADSKEVLHTRTLAELYAEQGMYEKAKEIFEDLAKASPLDEGLRDRLAEVNKELLKSEAPVSPVGCGEGGPAKGGREREVVIQRLEFWLAQVRAEKERRCSKSS
ncbi:MAG: tetratricopeptide repeat protein [bacterium]|nr:tetratricopeptide repeat protein [bacterium]